MKKYKIQLISDYNAFLSLKSEWNSLVIKNKYSIASLHEWQVTWWDVYGTGRELFIIVARDNDNNIKGILPFFRNQKTYFKFFDKPCLELIGTGEDIKDEICSPYLGFLIDKENRLEILDCLVTFLLSVSQKWQEILLTDVKTSSPNLQLFIYLARKAKLTSRFISDNICPYIELPSTWEELTDKNKISSKEKIPKKTLKLEQQGKVKHVEHRGNKLTPEAFSVFINLHQKRWNSIGLPGCFSSKKFTTFHTEIIKKLNEAGDAEPVLYTMELDGRPISIGYCFDFNGCTYGYLPAMDPDISPSLSSGFLGLVYEIQASISNGSKKYDFYKGDMSDYKFKWTKDCERIVRLRIEPNTLKSILLHGFDLSLRVLKIVYRAIKSNW